MPPHYYRDPAHGPGMGSGLLPRLPPPTCSRPVSGVGLGPFCYAASLLQSPGPCSPPVFRSAICDCLSLNVSFSSLQRCAVLQRSNSVSKRLKSQSRASHDTLALAPPILLVGGAKDRVERVRWEGMNFLVGKDRVVARRGAIHRKTPFSLRKLSCSFHDSLLFLLILQFRPSAPLLMKAHLCPIAVRSLKLPIDRIYLSGLEAVRVNISNGPCGSSSSALDSRPALAQLLSEHARPDEVVSGVPAAGTHRGSDRPGGKACAPLHAGGCISCCVFGVVRRIEARLDARRRARSRSAEVNSHDLPPRRRQRRGAAGRGGARRGAVGTPGRGDVGSVRPACAGPAWRFRVGAGQNRFRRGVMPSAWTARSSPWQSARLLQRALAARGTCTRGK